jgi:hypothetical protein
VICLKEVQSERIAVCTARLRRICLVGGHGAATPHPPPCFSEHGTGEARSTVEGTPVNMSLQTKRTNSFRFLLAICALLCVGLAWATFAA